jgi:hypothetical protein
VAQALGVGTQLHEPTLHALRRRAGAEPVAERRAEVPEGAELAIEVADPLAP